MDTNIEPDILHQLTDLIKAGKYEPVSVWKDYYQNWDNEQQYNFDLMLLSIIISEHREGREFGEVYKRASRCYGYLSQKRTEIQEPQHLPEEHSHYAALPSNLSTKRAQHYFTKAIEIEVIEKTTTGYKSKFNTKVQLAYFLELVFCRDDKGYDNGKNFPETDLNNLFNESRLGKARGQYLSNKSGKPKGHETIDEIFV